MFFFPRRVETPREQLDVERREQSLAEGGVATSDWIKEI